MIIFFLNPNFTSFLFVGNLLSLPFFYQLLLFVSYSKSLEYEYLYMNSRKDYFFCLLFGVVIISFLSVLKPLKVYFFSQSLIFYIIYLYNNFKNPNGTTVFHPALLIDNRYMTVFLIFVNAVCGMFLWTEFFIGIGAGYIFMKLEQFGILRTIGNCF